MNILVDTREKYPWDFYKCSSTATLELTSQKLDTGDYTIEGFEDILCIERKRTVSELAGNVTKARFTRELERMSNFQYSYLICEFGYNLIDSFPHNSEVPKKIRSKIKVRGPYIRKCLHNIRNQYGVRVLLCHGTAQAEFAAYNIMQRVCNNG